MHCPRCDTRAHADRTYCPACNWQLSKPFSGPVPAAASAGNNSFQATPQTQTATETFWLTPARPPWTNRPQRRRGLGRRRRALPLLNGNAIVKLPEEARWEAPARVEVVGMPVVQSSFDFAAAEREAQQLAAQAAAPVGLRCRAGLFDATLILLAGGGFFGLFALLGGQLGVGRQDLLIYLLAAYSLATLYFGLFTLLCPRTPGMQHYGLQVVSFEGKPLTPRQALWRAFGYVVSTGSLLLGFFWASLDERRLTWHDHISQTFITDRTLL